MTNRGEEENQERQRESKGKLWVYITIFWQRLQELRVKISSVEGQCSVFGLYTTLRAPE